MGMTHHHHHILFYYRWGDGEGVLEDISHCCQQSFAKSGTAGARLENSSKISLLRLKSNYFTCLQNAYLRVWKFHPKSHISHRSIQIFKYLEINICVFGNSIRKVTFLTGQQTFARSGASTRSQTSSALCACKEIKKNK